MKPCLLSKKAIKMNLFLILLFLTFLTTGCRHFTLETAKSPFLITHHKLDFDKTNYCLNLNPNNSSNTVDIQPCRLSDSNQHWFYNHGKLQPASMPKLCLEIANANNAASNKNKLPDIRVSPCTQSDHQLWSSTEKPNSTQVNIISKLKDSNGNPIGIYVDKTNGNNVAAYSSADIARDLSSWIILPTRFSGSISDNLLKGPSGKVTELSEWTVDMNTNQQPIVVDYNGREIFHFDHDFVTLSKTIDLIDYGFSSTHLDLIPDINIHARLMKNLCGGDKYSLKIDLLDANKNLLETAYNSGIVSISSNTICDKAHDFHDIRRILSDYPKGVRFIKWTSGGGYGGSDNSKHSGTMMADASLTIAMLGESFAITTSGDLNENCAIFSFINDRYEAKACSDHHYAYSCWDTINKRWQITEKTGNWYRGQYQCSKEFGKRAIFHAPVVHNMEKSFKDSVKADIWVNRTRHDANSTWTQWYSDSFENLLSNANAGSRHIDAWSYSTKSDWSIADRNTDELFILRKSDEWKPASRTKTVDLIKSGYTADELDNIPPITALQTYIVSGNSWLIHACLKIELLDNSHQVLKAANHCIGKSAESSPKEIRTNKISIDNYPEGVRKVRWTDNILDAQILYFADAKLSIDRNHEDSEHHRKRHTELLSGNKVAVKSFDIIVTTQDHYWAGTDEDVFFSYNGKSELLNTPGQKDFRRGQVTRYSIEMMKGKTIDLENTLRFSIGLNHDKWGRYLFTNDDWKFGGVKIVINGIEVFSNSTEKTLSLDESIFNCWFVGCESSINYAFRMDNTIIAKLVQSNSWKVAFVNDSPLNAEIIVENSHGNTISKGNIAIGDELYFEVHAHDKIRAKIHDQLATINGLEVFQPRHETRAYINIPNPHHLDGDSAFKQGHIPFKVEFVNHYNNTIELWTVIGPNNKHPQATLAAGKSVTLTTYPNQSWQAVNSNGIVIPINNRFTYRAKSEDKHATINSAAISQFRVTTQMIRHVADSLGTSLTDKEVEALHKRIHVINKKDILDYQKNHRSARASAMDMTTATTAGAAVGAVIAGVVATAMFPATATGYAAIAAASLLGAQYGSGIGITYNYNANSRVNIVDATKPEIKNTFVTLKSGDLYGPWALNRSSAMEDFTWKHFPRIGDSGTDHMAVLRPADSGQPTTLKAWHPTLNETKTFKPIKTSAQFDAAIFVVVKVPGTTDTYQMRITSGDMPQLSGTRPMHSQLTHGHRLWDWWYANSEQENNKNVVYAAGEFFIRKENNTVFGIIPKTGHFHKGGNFNHENLTNTCKILNKMGYDTSGFLLDGKDMQYAWQGTPIEELGFSGHPPRTCATLLDKTP